MKKKATPKPVLLVALGGNALIQKGQDGTAGEQFDNLKVPMTQIARLYGVTVQSIVKANNLWNPNVIYVGQRLFVPDP